MMAESHAAGLLSLCLALLSVSCWCLLWLCLLQVTGAMHITYGWRPWASSRDGSVAVDSLASQRLRVFVQKWDYMIFSKLAILAGDAKSANLPTLVKNKQLNH